MAPQVQLSRQTRQEVDRRASDYIRTRAATLPPIEEDEADERPGDAVAEAEQAREAADAAEDAAAELAAGDADLRGVAQASAATARRAERIATARREATDRRAASRRERTVALAAIRREAYDRAFAELGIQLVVPGAGGDATRPVASDDLTSNEEDVTAPDLDPSLTGAAALQQEDPEHGPAPGIGAASALQPGVGRIDDRAAPQPIPQKWRRMQLGIGEFRFDPADNASRDAASATFAERLGSSLDAILATWLASEDGQRDAYRPGERILPSNFASRESWNRYLQDLRTRRAATMADIRPDLTGVAPHSRG